MVFVESPVEVLVSGGVVTAKYKWYVLIMVYTARSSSHGIHLKTTVFRNDYIRIHIYNTNFDHYMYRELCPLCARVDNFMNIQYIFC